MADNLRPFQKRVCSHVIAGRNVILQAPTGSGKTRAALAPFIKGYDGPADRFPRALRYAVPMRVLANQFVNEYQQHFERLNRHLDGAFERFAAIGVPVPAIQTGELPQDPRFESPATFCTIDQLLASFLGMPYGLGARQGNINIAGVAASYLVLDEFHLYPLLTATSARGARTTVLAMLRMLNGLTPWVMMTATFSTTLLHELARLLDAEVECLRDENGALRESEMLELQDGRARTLSLAPQPLTARAVLDRHTGTSLVVCNTVFRAQQLYLDILRLAPHDLRVLLLHSRFTTDDRCKKADELEALLSEKVWVRGQHRGPQTIVVATQVVEVGLNISAEVLHTELAPANSIVQRAGRCARFSAQQGQVIVYPLERHPTTRSLRSLPYPAAACERTLNTLEDVVATDNVRGFGFQQEQDLIDMVHTAEDRELIRQFKLDEPLVEDIIFKNMLNPDRGFARSLIRDVSQVRVIVHQDPQNAIQTDPWRWQSFGIHPDTLAAAYRRLDERRASLGENAPDATMLRPEPIEVAAAEQDSGLHTHYDWVPVGSEAAAKSAIVAIPPEFATYSRELGFVLLDGRLSLPPEMLSPFESAPEKGSPPGPRSDDIEQQSYVEHISGLANVYQQFGRQQSAYLARHLEERLNAELAPVSPGAIDRAIRLALACHDVGKLAQGWQTWARDWHALLVQRYGPEYELMPGYVAKTIYSWKEHKSLQSNLEQRHPPHHACESVCLAGPLILAALDGNRTLTQATFSAIARHHTTDATTCSPVVMDEAALPVLGAALQRVGLLDGPLYLTHVSRATPMDPVDLLAADLIADPDRGRQTQTWLYALIVRALRLADQRADRFRDRVRY